jgi:hypothetical protein
MIKNVVLTVIFFLTVLSIPYIVDAGVVLDPKNQTPSGSWVDPNFNQTQGDYFVSKDGLLCANKIWQVQVNGVMTPARKCRLPDGAWATFFY